MTNDFHKFKEAIEHHFEQMSKTDLFVMNVDKDLLWQTYLDKFPTGSNPIFRERSVHDCSCCRHFIKTIGNVVTIKDGTPVSIWDLEIEDPVYQPVAAALADLVRSKPIANQFLHYESQIGTDHNFEKDYKWEHFYVNVPLRNHGRNFIQKKAIIPTMLGESRALHDVFARSLQELTIDSIDTVLDLIGQNSLYRGAEHKSSLESFKKVKKKYDELPDNQRDFFVWSQIGEISGAVAKIRNTSIGTLLIDLSAGVDLEDAVRKFEALVAPSNYKRPVALVTRKMVEDARTKVAELGLTDALNRRYATLADISVNNIIFADHNARKRMQDNAFDLIETKSSVPKNLDKVEKISIEKFIKDVVPKVNSIELMFDNSLVNNLVSLIAPLDTNCAPLFKWDNNFSWSYNGDMADSVKERVKKAGGNVSGDLCCRLAWYNYDDLDLHMTEPGIWKNPNDYEIYFANKGMLSPCGGRLDVDMNAGNGRTRTPVENIVYSNRNLMREGEYTLFVNQFNKREMTDEGFEVEIDYLGKITRFMYDQSVRDKQTIVVAKFEYSHARGIEIFESLPSRSANKTVWNLKTSQFHKVNVLMQSPNFWDDKGVGNRHFFFMLDGCQNDGKARGFFNEFLRPELDKHRKVIEILGSKMKVAESVDQLSGIGVSSTQHPELLVRVGGNFTRTLQITF